MQPTALLALALIVLSCAFPAGAKECSRFVTAQMRQSALTNAQNHSWAQSWRDALLAAGNAWVDIPDRELWAFVTSQELPRACYIAKGILYEGKKDACPKCGKPIGYDGKMSFRAQDWKVRCPGCGEAFPKNDFRAFYQSALDEHGFFRRERGDKDLLFNSEHPDPADPLHRLYVDDGYGMTDESGNIHHVIAYYNSQCQWANIRAAVRDLAMAYAASSDPRYAHKAGVLLDRIADVYPDMDYDPFGKLGFQHSHGGSLQGRIIGNIWEAPLGEELARAYDLVYDAISQDTELCAFSAAQSAKHGLGDKSTPAAVCRHIEDHLLLEILKSVKDGRNDGNTGMTHTCLAVTAIALDRPGVTAEWLDWLFDPEYPVTNPEYHRTKDPVPWAMIEGLDRDGMGGECGGYGLIWSRGMAKLAETLACYPQYDRHSIPREYPKLLLSYLVEPRLNCLDAVMPNIGDTGSCGSWGRAGNTEAFVRGYRLLGEPELAKLAWRYSQGSKEALRLRYEDLFAEAPEGLIEEIARIGQAEPPLLRSDFLGRYGQAYVQTPHGRNGRAAYLHFGWNKGHSHHDCLTLGLYAHNVDMLPDHGYPEFTGSWPQRIAWTSNTSSHCTLLVGDKRSGYSPGGKLSLFVDAAPVRAIEAGSDTAYAGVTSLYRRTVLMVDVDEANGYLLDVFRARGGGSHRLIYPGPARTAQVSGLELTAQAKGTFAGPGVQYTKLAAEGETIDNTSGFSYLYDVQRSQPTEGGFAVDWRVEDLRGRIAPGSEPHLRLHALTPCDEVALAGGQPPQNKSGNPESLRYLIQSRLGDNVQSQFVNVLEPYDTKPFVRSVRRLEARHAAGADAVAAVAVELENGCTDIVIACEQPTEVTLGERDIRFNGTVGFVRLADGEVKTLRLIAGTYLEAAGVAVRCDRAGYEGTVQSVDVSDPTDNRVVLDPPLPADCGLEGMVIHFGNALPQDTSYRVEAVTQDAVSTGPTSLVLGFKDLNDFAAGYTYLVKPGDRYKLPCVAGLDRG